PALPVRPPHPAHGAEGLRGPRPSRACEPVSVAALPGVCALGPRAPVDAPEGCVKAGVSSLLLLVLFACGEEHGRTMYSDAVAALRSGDLVKAEIAAEKSVAENGPKLAPDRDFMLGCGAFRRCEREEIKIYGPLGGSAAIDAALAHAINARDFFESAAAGRSDWPEARRNGEGAIQKVAILRKMKEEADAKAQSRPQPQPKPNAANDANAPKERTEDKKPTPRVDPMSKELPPDQITRVLERLAEKEKE